MKQCTIALVLMILAISSLHAQDLRFGAQTGVSFSWLKTDNSKIQNNGTALGGKIGMVAEYSFRENYSFATGLGFIFNTGGKLKNEIGGNVWPSVVDTALNAGANFKYHINYVEIPLSLKLRTQEFGYLRYYAELPIFTIGFRSSAKGDIEGSTGNDLSKQIIKEEVNAFNLSWGFGGGVEYNVSTSTALVAGLYYQQGFSDITQDGRQLLDGKEDNSKGTIGNVTLRIGVLF